jgi:LysR family transcriptional regulator, low CO2-responsive transcriptional regulator
MGVGYVPVMELRHLRSFAAAAERQSFTRAAESLSLTQAAVSQHIATLEKELETELFERKGRGVSLTVAGRRMYEYARQILDLVAEATSQVASVDQQVAGVLRVATSTVPSEWLVPELLAGFRARYPDVRESLTVSDSRVATLAVESGEVDVGFVGELPRSSELEAQAVAEDELVLVVAADHHFAKKGFTTLKQLIREPLIVREPGSGTRRCIEQAMEEQGVSPSKLHIAMEINSNEAIRAAVERRAGVAFLSQREKRHETGLTTITVRSFHPRRQLYVINNPLRALPTPARQFLAFVKEWHKSQQP